ncbi:MAG: hypothetical protein AB7F75_09345 [Planctomycetota bacterium]
MNAKVIQYALWAVFVGLVSGGAWKLRAGLPSPEPVDINASLYDPEVIKGETVDYNANLLQYKPLETLSFQWVPIKPPPSSSPTSVERFKPPLALTRVINQKMVQLLDTTSNTKTFYNVGESIIQKMGMVKKPMGKLLELNTTDPMRAVLKIEYLNPQNQAMEPFELALDTNKTSLLSTVQKKANARKLKIGDPNVLEAHEGKVVGPNQYELNYEFFNAIMDNKLSELGKIMVNQDPSKEYRVTKLGGDSVLRKFGFKDEDVLLKFNDQDIKSMQQVIAAAGSFLAGGSPKVKIQVRRAGQVVAYDFTVLTNKGEFKEKYE